MIITPAYRYVGDFDRWPTETGVVFGDGAAAVVLSRRLGFAKIWSRNCRGCFVHSSPVCAQRGRTGARSAGVNGGSGRRIWCAAMLVILHIPDWTPRRQA